jgi:hypothetical protein
MWGTRSSHFAGALDEVRVAVDDFHALELRRLLSRIELFGDDAHRELLRSGAKGS